MNVSAREGGYIGVKTGVMDVSISAYDMKMPLGIQGGYAFSNGFAIEGEFTKTNFDLPGASGDITIFAAYAAYCTQVKTRASHQYSRQCFW